MKNYRNAIGALVLAFVFSTSTFAEGVIWMEKTPPPPSSQGSTVMDTQRTTSQADSGMWTEIANPTPETHTLTEFALSLLQTLIPLL